MRVIIPGGSGLIGRRLTDELAQNGHEVIVLSRSPEQVTGLPETARAVQWDGRSPDGWGDLVNGAKAIINLAGAGIGDKRWTDERKQIILDSRLQSTTAVVNAIAQADDKPEVLLQASAVGYYGNRGAQLLTEDVGPGDGFLSEVCQKWEAAAQPAAEHTRLVILRTGVVLTTHGGALEKMLIPFKMFAGGPFGDGQQWFPWIHIDDEVHTILHLMNSESAEGPYNLCSPEILRNKAFADALGEAMSRPSLVPTPAFALKLALGEMSALLLHSQRQIPQKLVEQEDDFQFLYPHPVPALRDIVFNDK